jgi:hypothetical protein
MASKKLTQTVVIADGTTPTAGPSMANSGYGFYVSLPKTNTATSAFVGDNNFAASSDVSSSDLYIIEEGVEYYFSPKFYKSSSDLWLVSSTTDAATFCFRVA